MKCFMCQEKPAKKLTAERSDGMVYVNAENRKLFCSKRCAANWALLWANQNGDEHWCAELKKWVHCDEYSCPNCKGDEE